MAERVRQRRLTVVDDSPELLALFGEVFRSDGMEIMLFDGAVTIRDIEGSRPDLVVLDMRLGNDGVAGLELVRSLRAHRDLRNVPIIVCSAAMDTLVDHADELAGSPDVFVLSKPFSLDELESCVEEALSRSRGAPLAS